MVRARPMPLPRTTSVTGPLWRRAVAFWPGAIRSAWLAEVTATICRSVSGGADWPAAGVARIVRASGRMRGIRRS